MSFVLPGLLIVAVGTVMGGIPTFQHDVLPIFEKSCNGCHGVAKTVGLDLRSIPSILSGSASGKVLIPGKSSVSLLWKKVESGVMPLGKNPLSPEEKDIVRRWIDEGQFPTATPTQSRITDRARKFWAYQKPVKHPIPAVRNRQLVRNEVDGFVLQKLELKGLALNPEASREKLIRRVYLDVTGISPSPEEVRAFTAGAESYESLVDRLLDSPRYGERWARHWLDVAGYADGNGYLGDEPRTHAWRYRDWVIRALNRDMPYDQFVMQQLAGDQMSDWKMGEKLSADAVERLTATGFLRLTPDGTDNQSIYEIDKQYDALHAVTEVSMKAVMGISLGCARCHDHKFDPLLQKDYYGIQAMLRPVYDPDDVFPKKDTRWLAANIGSGEWPARFIPNATKQQMDEYLRLQKEASQSKPLFVLMAAAREKWIASQMEKLPEPERSEAINANKTAEGKRDENQRALMKKFTITDDELAKADASIAQARELQNTIVAKIKAARPEMIWAAWDVSTDAKTPLLIRGDFESPGDPVEPGVPAILDDPSNPFRPPNPEPGATHTGRRLAFAKWLTRPDHPLTARVIVNRVWQHHFGAGIVTTPDDFGSQGARPTHPELLDRLAVSFVEHGWSLKWLHREILLSATYRQSSTASPEKLRIDEPNKLLSRWPARRMEAEAVRDSVLHATGQLSLEMYGEPIALCTSPDGNYLPDATGRIDGERIRGFNFNPPACKAATKELKADRNPNRRSVYLQIRRVAATGFLVAFDVPLMDTNASTRFRAAVPQQALAVLHNPLMLDGSASLAARTKADAGDDMVARIRRAIELVYSRNAEEGEISFGFAEVSKQKDAEAGLRMFCQALLGSNEFLYVD